MQMNIVEIEVTPEEMEDLELYCPFCGTRVASKEGINACPHLAFWFLEAGGEARKELLDEIDEETWEEGGIYDVLEELKKKIERGVIFEISQVSYMHGPVDIDLYVAFSLEPFDSELEEF